MMPGMNPRQMNKMMQKMGIKQDEIEASEVIINCSVPDRVKVAVSNEENIESMRSVQILCVCVSP